MMCRIPPSLPSPPPPLFFTPAKSLHVAKKALQAKLFSTVEQQLWETLPGFCTHPTDVTTVSGPMISQTVCSKAGQHCVACCKWCVCLALASHSSWLLRC